MPDRDDKPGAGEAKPGGHNDRPHDESYRPAHQGASRFGVFIGEDEASIEALGAPREP